MKFVVTPLRRRLAALPDSSVNSNLLRTHSICHSVQTTTEAKEEERLSGGSGSRALSFPFSLSALKSPAKHKRMWPNQMCNNFRVEVVVGPLPHSTHRAGEWMRRKDCQGTKDHHNGHLVVRSIQYITAIAKGYIHSLTQPFFTFSWMCTVLCVMSVM